MKLKTALALVRSHGYVIKEGRPVKLKRAEIDRIQALLALESRAVVTFNGKAARVFSYEAFSILRKSAAHARRARKEIKK